MSIQRVKSERVPELFAQRNTRRSDPSTSREAARNHASRASTNAAVIYEAVRSHPDKTAVELAQVIGRPSIDRYEVSRRLADLKDSGRVRVSGRRRCEIKATLQSTWTIED